MYWPAKGDSGKRGSVQRSRTRRGSPRRGEQFGGLGEHPKLTVVGSVAPVALPGSRTTFLDDHGRKLYLNHHGGNEPARQSEALRAAQNPDP